MTSGRRRTTHKEISTPTVTKNTATLPHRHQPQGGRSGENGASPRWTYRKGAEEARVGDGGSGGEDQRGEAVGGVGEEKVMAKSMMRCVRMAGEVIFLYA